MSNDFSWGDTGGYGEPQSEDLARPELRSEAAVEAARDFVEQLERNIGDIPPLPEGDPLHLGSTEEIKQYLTSAFLSALSRKAVILGPRRSTEIA